jgi:thioredoxin 1
MANSPAQPGGDGSPSATHVETEEAFESLLATEETVLVDFYADWCGPCQMMAPVVDEFAAESDVAVAKVDVDALQGIAATYEVRSIPTFIVFEDGEMTEQLVGMQEKGTLRSAIQ